MKTGFAREIITPKRGAPLCGYFNPRPNIGIYDDLALKTLVIEESGVKSGIVIYDLCFIGLKLVERLKKALCAAGIDFAENILFCATHSHTAPYSKPFFGAPEDAEFIEGLIAKTVSAVKRAEASLYETTLEVCVTKCATQAFNRRYWMKNGKVVPIPQAQCRHREPEGPRRLRHPRAEIRSGGTRFACACTREPFGHDRRRDGLADWPGRMERYVQTRSATTCR